MKTAMEVVGRQLGAQPTGLTEGIEYESCQVRARGGAVGERGGGVFAGRELNLPTGESGVVFGPQVPQREWGCA